MLDDDDPGIRELAYLRIIEAREQNETSDIREFNIPKINFNCKSYCELIDWENEILFEPPILRNVEISLDNLGELMLKKITDHEFGSNLRDMPCHTQAVERTVQTVAAVASSVSGTERREGKVLTIFKSREFMPQFQHKAQFNAKDNISDTLPKV